MVVGRLIVMVEDSVRIDFESQLELVVGSLFGAAMRYARNQADAEDLVQMAVINAWRAFDRFDAKSENAFRAWMFTILQNAWISEFRRRSRRVQEVTAETEDGFSLFDALVDATGSAEADVLARIPDVEVKHALDSLNEDFRTAVLLCDVEGFSYAEIAEITDVPVGTVMSRIHRGRKALQRALWSYALERGLVEEGAR